MDQPESAGVRLLSLDGGDLRAVSQLIALDAFMRRVEWDRKSKNRILPCDYFHMVSGVGTGGIIAILLVSLRMHIEDAIEEFIDIWQSVFADAALEPVIRSEKLEAVMKDLLKRKGIPENQKMISENEHEEELGCKVFVCASPASSLGVCEKFYSYRSRDASTKPTIIEAIRATCAIPTMFSPVSIRSMGCRVFYVTASHSFNNPAAETIKEATQHFGRSRPVACLISLGCGQSLVRMLDSVAGTQSADLIETITSDSEVVHQDLSWRIGTLDVYYRFCVGPDSQHKGNPSYDPVEGIVTFSKTHLGLVATMEKVDQCVAVSERLGRITLGDLCGVRKAKFAAAHNLPSQSAFFVERPELIEQMSEHLFRIGPETQRRLVLSGLGGVGKTQITISFLLKFLPRFRHVLFIDGSSVQSIESGIVAKVNSLGTTYCRTTALEALDVLANPDHEITRDWAIIYDNVDDPKIKIGTYFPRSTFGTIIVTTRNPTLGNLAPSAHMKLDVMSEEAAVDVLLRSAIDPSRVPTEEDKGYAREIVKALGYLPVALVQAGYFIKLHDCMSDYLRRLVKRRPQILNRPAEAQLDNHYHGIYATLDVTWPHLSTRTKKFLSTLGFVNYTGFPVVLIYRAAKRGFLFEPFNFSEQLPQFQQSAQLLCDIFRPDENWDEQDVDDLVAELEQYSLITRMTTFMVTTLRLHPLVHSWVHDRLNLEEQQIYQAAAVRLLVCGTGEDDDDIFEFIYPHVALLSDQLGKLHVNDRAGLAAIFTHQGDIKTSIGLWESIHRDVVAALSEEDLIVSEIKLKLASVYWNSEDNAKQQMAAQLESDALELRARTLGPGHFMTIIAYSQMVRGISRSKNQKRIALAALFSLVGILSKLPGKNWEIMLQAKEAQASAAASFTTRSFGTWVTLLEERIKRSGPEHHCTVRAADALIAAYDADVDGSQCSESSDLSLDSETDHSESAIDIWTTLVEARTKRRGSQHPDTLKAMEGLAWSHSFQLEYQESVEIWKQVIGLRTEAQGRSHKETLHAMEQLAKVYALSEQYSDAEDQWREVIALRREIHGLGDNVTVKAMAQLAMMHERDDRYEEAETHWKDIIAQMTEARGPSDQNTLYAMTGLAKMYTKNERYDKAEEHWMTMIHLRKDAQGSGHKDTVEAMIALGMVYAKVERYNDAEGQWREAIAVSKDRHGSLGRLRVKAMEALANMNQTRGQNEGAIEWWKESIALRREMQNRLQGETPKALDNLKLLYNTFSNCDTYADIEDGENSSDSDSSDEEMVDVLKKMMEPDNKGFFTPERKGVLSAIHSLGKAYMGCGRYEEAEAILAPTIKEKIEGFDDDDSGINDMLEELLEEAREYLIPTLGVETRETGQVEDEEPVGDDAVGESERRRGVRDTVRQMFPGVEAGVIDMVLEAQGGDGDATINVLLDMLVGD